MEKVKQLVVGGTAYQLTDETKLPLPQQAQVGQVILVAEVDGEGRVIATQAADPAPSYPDGDEVMY